MANLGSQTSAPGTKWVAYVLAGALAALVVLVLSRSTLPGPQQGRAGVILRSPAPRTLRRLQARFTLADLLAAARLTGYLNCTGASRNEMYASSPGSDLVIKTAEVACAAPEVDSTPPRSPYEHCCQHPVYIRPGTSDAPTFEEIAVRHVFYFL
ncbi:hypothetical protein COHA_000331 [Chlorella ohadii]|uniref:Uncharacterized protein n=1 Tax=Chlorella ohadii TaxID=2649997 RepID=A0AAD5DZV5_9CHLO|nr:hypothetical protein COHA_000331 [Chlorella ohadii]